MDSNLDKFGIKTYGISITTLEEVFLRVESDAIAHDREEMEQNIAAKKEAQKERANSSHMITTEVRISFFNFFILSLHLFFFTKRG